MKLAKSLFLSSAAGLVAVSGASAADLGVKKPTAVEFVRTCPAYGAGFFVVPGTTSCLKIVGRVRADFISGNSGTQPNVRWARSDNSLTMRARGYVGFDHRTATDYGLLRTYVRAFFASDNGAGSTASLTTGAVSNQAYLEYAYIQWGGLTVGRASSIFDNPWFGAYAYTGIVGQSDMGGYVNTINYTFTAGGFSAALGLEANPERRAPVYNTTGLALTQGGQTLPDVVGKLGYDAAWGSIHLAGAIHNVRDATAAGFADSKIGYAAGLGVSVNLPMLNPGSLIWINGTVANGASGYVTGGNVVNMWYTGTYAPAVIGDAIVDGGSLHLTSSWGVTGGAKFQVTPTVFFALNAGYGKFDPYGATNTVTATAGNLQVGWTPVAGMLVGAEVGYRGAKAQAAAVSAVATGAGVAYTKSESGYYGRLRFQRDF